MSKCRVIDRLLIETDFFENEVSKAIMDGYKPYGSPMIVQASMLSNTRIVLVMIKEN